MSTKLSKNKIKILATLAQIKKPLIAADIMRYAGVSRGTTYGLLDKMLEESLVTLKVNDSGKKTYTISKKGREHASTLSKIATDNTPPAPDIDNDIDLDDVANDFATNLSRLISVNAQYRKALVDMRNGLVDQIEQIDTLLDKFKTKPVKEGE